MDGPLTIAAAAPLLRSGELTPSTLLEQCLARMDAYELFVKAWVHVDRERARREAAVLSEELTLGKDRGPLHGIPMGIKDIIDVFDMPTGCGSKLWANSYARHDAEVVANLRRAGALILGKTVTTAYAYLDPSPTRNPWNLERTPGGSSSGSAAAVACGMCLAALATQTGGSTIRPASYCGVSALKPTHGAISVKGVLPLAPSLDHIGIMANCIADLETIFQYSTNHLLQSRLAFPGETSLIELCGLTNDRLSKRIGPATLDAIRSVMEGVRSSGESLRLTHGMDDILASYLCILGTECAEYHSKRLERSPDEYGPRMRELIENGRRHTALEYRHACDAIARFQAALGNRFPIMPATPDIAPTRETTGDPIFNIPWSFAGRPVVSLPCGIVENLPVALQIAGPAHREDCIFEIAKRAEKILGVPKRLPPVPR
jgi:aspartyl-tRNA(Asn)/glutamyl-tRNA(Gln) amidotransferase subunit A